MRDYRKDRKKKRSAARGLDPAYPMGLAISHQDGSILIGKNPMRARESARLRIAIRSVSPLSRARDQLESAAGKIYHANAVTLGIRQINVPARAYAAAFGAAHGCY